MASSFDYKKEYKDLYIYGLSGAQAMLSSVNAIQIPMLIDVPSMNFIMINGAGDPNTSDAYKDALEILYGLSYTIKMSKKGSTVPDGYFDYVVPPLEGLWWFNDESSQLTDKSKFLWTVMIRQPEFVSRKVFDWAVLELKKKKPDADISKARFETLVEGLCAQILHFGSYDNEPVSLRQLEPFILDKGYQNAISDVLPEGQVRRHHEIYLNDPRKTTPEKLRTVLRIPVKQL